MECDCNDVAVRTDHLYDEACVWLAERKRDCTVVDAGFAGNFGMFQLQWHLRRHGVKAHTIGIDEHKVDSIVDEFIHADIRDVKMTGVADIVLCRNVIGIFDDDAAGFKKVVGNFADWLKPDGILYIDIEKSQTLMERLRGYWRDQIMRAMTKSEAKEHAEWCHLAESDECKHGGEWKNRFVCRVDDGSAAVKQAS